MSDSTVKGKYTGSQERLASFTPGPWKLHHQASTAVVGSKGFVVAACGGYQNNNLNPDELATELQANARLIAAAPDLLAALEECITWIATCDASYTGGSTEEKARAAIAKARDSEQRSTASDGPEDSRKE